MTRKDYQLIADAINEGITSFFDEGGTLGEYSAGVAVLDHIIYKLSNKLEDDNPRFDRDRFAEAIHLR